MTGTPTGAAAPGIEELLPSLRQRQVRAEERYGLIEVDLEAMHLLAEDGDGVAVGFEIPKGPMNNHPERIA